ncbi:MAG: FKBP-type peptidyl-prolyl cis-trans isomerase N-terminal domain-containing protein [Bacteroidales bacterium]|jgi:FKBP-type peptidyl-prolyl cis-trans isomerase FklB|nr:FKBP-type peptidyl-prolyl cis-trans isomerase N-terminal domain-containing protein [Bacteroidales bacterium]MDD4703133.1 FKBP-type peptidyl-prolyl cis-trans isomerase N-terminal domain-containing protein [Bacteroidales bacterium]MDX9797431.1 FKBP-type peptidyl-prolyl cis-trans isomerase N-terminal domain-containing protein [Bacteroidales bacterium]
MKQLVLKSAVIIILFATIFAACSQKKEVSSKDLKNLVDSASYCLGANMGKQMMVDKMEINPEVLMNAFYQAYEGDTSLLIREENMQEVIVKYQRTYEEKQKEAAKEKGKLHRQTGEKFLAENKSKEGVITTASGLQFKAVKQGNGNTPTDEDRVRIQYRLKLIDGKVVESTFERGQDPVIMGLKNIIPGMVEGLKLMKEGGSYLLWVHPDLAYGDMDSPELPAGSVLCFEIDLIEVVKDSNLK